MAEKICAKCNKSNPEQAKFCGGCGSPLGASSPAIGEADIEALFESSFSTPQGSAGSGFDPERSDLFGAEVDRQPSPELDQLFQSSGENSLESIFDEYVEAAEADGFTNIPQPQDNSISDNSQSQTGLVNEAFNALMEQENEGERHKSDLDASSPSAALLEDDILALAESALEGNDSDSPAISDGTDEAIPFAEAEIEEVDTDDEDSPKTVSSAKKKSKKSKRSRAIPDSLKKARLLGQTTFTNRVAKTASFLLLSLGTSWLFFPSIPAQLPRLAILAGPLLLLVCAFILKKIFKAKEWPLGFFNILMISGIFAGAFHAQGKIVLPQGLSTGLVQSIAMTLMFVTAMYVIITSKLLHRVFRYVLLTIGVYSISGVVKGMATGLTYAQTVSLRQLNPAEAQGMIWELAKLFEPTFTGVNLFIPVVMIVLLFESMRLIMHKFVKEALPGLLILLLLGGCLFTNIQIYEELQVPNLKQMITTGKVINTNP